MLLKELIEGALMSAEDQLSQADQKTLVALLLKSYSEGMRKQQMNASSVLFTPRASNYSTSADSLIGLRRSFFIPATTTNPFSLIHHRNSISPDRNTRSESTFYHGGRLNESYSEGQSSSSSRSLSIAEHGKICKVQADSYEEYKCFERGFNQLYQSSLKVGGARSTNSAGEVLAANVKQLYLDCYIGSENFMTVLMTQLRNSSWVTAHQFMMSLEEIQTRALDQLVLYMGESHSHKKASTIQKLVCKNYSVFFKFHELLEKKDLNILELRLAVSMSLRGRKNFTEQMVDSAMTRILERLAEIPKVFEGKIPFRDFYYVLRHRKISSV